MTTPGGWTLIGTVDLPPTTSRPSLWAYYRTANSEPASYSFIINQTCTLTGIMASYDGNEITVPQEALGINTGFSINPIAPSISISNNSLLLRICAMDGQNLPTSLSSFYPANSIHRNAIELGGVGNGCAIGYAEQLRGPGSTGSATFTTFTTDEYACFSIAFNGSDGQTELDTIKDVSVNENHGTPSGNASYDGDFLSYRRRV